MVIHKIVVLLLLDEDGPRGGIVPNEYVRPFHARIRVPLSEKEEKP